MLSAAVSVQLCKKIQGQDIVYSGTLTLILNKEQSSNKLA